MNTQDLVEEVEALFLQMQAFEAADRIGAEALRDAIQRTMVLTVDLIQQQLESYSDE